MESDKKQYRFINTQTGNTIAYLSIAIETPVEEITVMLEKRRNELATEHGVYFGTIYWEEKKATK